MKNQIENLENFDFPIVQEKKFNLTKTVLLSMAAIVLVTLSAMQVLAFTTDKTLESLEATHLSAVATYSKNYESTAKFLEATNQAADTVCNSYNALKNYKEVKGYDLKDPTYNPCQTMQGFTLPEKSQPEIQK